VYAFYGDAEKEKADGEFGGYHCDAVEEVAVPPAVDGGSDVGRFQVGVVAAGAVFGADVRKGTVSDECYLKLG
jgi:hypothetical protein